MKFAICTKISHTIIALAGVDESNSLFVSTIFLSLVNTAGIQMLSQGNFVTLS